MTEVEDYEKEDSLLPMSSNAISHYSTHIPSTSGFNFPEDPLLDNIMDELTKITELMKPSKEINSVLKYVPK